MKTHKSHIKTALIKALAVAGLALFGSQAFADTTIAKWTFETLTIGANSAYTNWSNGRSITNVLPEFGNGYASGFHSGFGSGNGVYSTPAGNGSTKSLSSNGWTNNPAAASGDYYQFAVSTVGYTNINMSFDAVGSATGPRDFVVKYSTDGVTYTQFGSAYTVLSSPSWSSGAPVTGETYTYDFSPITSLANASVVYIRLVVNSTNNIGGGSGGGIGGGGTSRIDNVIVAGTVPGAPSIINSPQNTTNYFGDTVTLTVFAGGSDPLGYFWFTNLNTAPLTDGSSGYGVGTISGSTSATLTLSFVNTNQAGNYQVIVSNSVGTVTSAVAHVVVNIRPTTVANIADLHKLHDANFVLYDTTNLYTVEGIVTTIGDLVSGTTEVESFFVQDGTGGADVFFRGGFPFPNFGDHVKITAPLLQFNGVLEMAPVNGNPAHSIQILGSGTVPAPQYFDFSTLPTPIVMEESLEGRYLVVSNVFLDVTNQLDKHLAGNEIINMTNLNGQVFHMIVANNPVLGPYGYTLPCSFATAVTGVMSQSQTSGTVLTNGYEIILSDFSQITPGTVPSVPVSAVKSKDVIQLLFSPFFSLQSATNVAGPYVTIPGATNPFTISPTNPANFYRIVYTNN